VRLQQIAFDFFRLSENFKLLARGHRFPSTERETMKTQMLALSPSDPPLDRREWKSPFDFGVSRDERFGYWP
jgi:hypothetical protein